ncbi:hypothetical protein [Aquimarina sp. 2304DJ70-9]|uniref:hypothetical protein n=1 Tax=Aquimarina penaris TaxID=3231044 RepID=UPI00346369D6
MNYKTSTKTAISTRQPYFMRLSLMNNELTSMLSKLNSYRCEPCTYAMYDQYTELNTKGRLLKQTIDDIVQKIKNSIKSSKEVKEEINAIMITYHKFQKSLSSYLTEAVIHH